MRVLSAILTAGLIGVIIAVAAWFVFAGFTNASVVVFRTGSMAPAMPQGTLAVVAPVDAADLKVGDVITVARGDHSLPVTHRIIEISSPSDLPDPTREIFLQGDANNHPDMEPYHIEVAQRVVFSVPRLGSVLMALQSFPGTALLVTAAGALTTWALWPRGKREGAR